MSADHHFELGGDVIGQEPGAAGAGPVDPEAHAGQHRLDVQLVGRALEREVAGGEPHVAVARLLLPAGLVATVRLEEPAAEVVDGGAAHVFDEVALHVLRFEQPDVGAVPLDRADAGQRGHERLGHPGPDEETRLLDVGERALPPFERHIDELGAEALAVLLAPGRDGRAAATGTGRDVGPVGVEAAVAAHAAGDQRLAHRQVAQELALGELHLCRAHGRSSPAGSLSGVLRSVHWHVYRPRASSCRAPNDVPPSSRAPRAPSRRPASPRRPWTTWPPAAG